MGLFLNLQFGLLGMDAKESLGYMIEEGGCFLMNCLPKFLHHFTFSAAVIAAFAPGLATFAVVVTWMVSV